MTDRPPTHDEFERWRLDQKSDVKTLEARLIDVRDEFRQDAAGVREDLAQTRERLAKLETSFSEHKSWHRPAFDALTQDVRGNRDQIGQLWTRVAIIAVAVSGTVSGIPHLLDALR